MSWRPCKQTKEQPMRFADSNKEIIHTNEQTLPKFSKVVVVLGGGGVMTWHFPGCIKICHLGKSKNYFNI